MKAKTKFTRLWSILLALAMVVGMLPIAALAAGSATETADFVSDPTTALALLNDAKTGTTASTWDGDTKTLTLGGVNFETSAATAVKLPDGAIIVLKGENTIKGGDSDSAHSYGIWGAGDLTIKGSGTINVTGGDTTLYEGKSCGIFASNDLNIEGGTVTATGCAADYSYGIRAADYIYISGGNVTGIGGTANDGSYGLYVYNDDINISGGTFTATGGVASGENGESCGIWANNNVTVQDTAVVTAEGGEGGSSFGIWAEYDATISGTVTAEGGTATDQCSVGIYANYEMTISGGEVKATGGTVSVSTSTGAYSYGINGKIVTISDGTVEATGGTASGTGASDPGNDILSYGIGGSGVSISGGTVIAKGGTATDLASNANYGKSYGICTGSRHLSISGTAEVTATGGTATGKSYGIFADDGNMTISGGTLIATGTSALNKNPNTLPSSTYWWRTSKTGNYSVHPDSEYTWDSLHQYVEIRDTNPGYTVSFDANGGKSTMADVTGISGEYTLHENALTAPDGKQFKAWSVDGKEKAVGDKITVTANTTVQAVWETVPATPTEYDILNGANSKWTQDSDGNISVRGSGEFSKFVGIKVDGKTVDEKYYTVKEGSTIVTLKPEYLNTLTVGKHTLEIVWTDGSASTTFTVKVDSPQTGDNSMIGLWIALLFVSAAGVLSTAVLGKKKKRSAK